VRRLKERKERKVERRGEGKLGKSCSQRKGQETAYIKTIIHNIDNHSLAFVVGVPGRDHIDISANRAFELWRERKQTK
jgi:hypothetical protein